MVKRFLFLIILSSAVFLLNSNNAFAIEQNPGRSCDPGRDTCRKVGDIFYDCLPYQGQYLCLESPVSGVFGKIKAPAPLAGFLSKDPTGARAISDFVSRLAALIFSISAIVLVFMILWGAFEWLTSGGDKEKLSGAQKRIINALIGIMLLSVAFAIIRILGVFTGFTFFKS